MDADAWNDRYRTSELIWKAEPNRFLPPAVADLSPGRAVDLACGEGRNAVWLAAQGWQVLGVDFSSVAIDKARSLAHERGVEVAWEVADLATWEPPAQSADLVGVFYLQVPSALRRTVLARAWSALAPGGVLLVVAHDSANIADGVGGPQDPSVLYTAEDVVADLLDVDGGEVVVERAERVERPVPDAPPPGVALDCLVRARRSG